MGLKQKWATKAAALVATGAALSSTAACATDSPDVATPSPEGSNSAPTTPGTPAPSATAAVATPTPKASPTKASEYTPKSEVPFQTKPWCGPNTIVYGEDKYTVCMRLIVPKDGQVHIVATATPDNPKAEPGLDNFETQVVNPSGIELKELTPKKGKDGSLRWGWAVADCENPPTGYTFLGVTVAGLSAEGDYVNMPDPEHALGIDARLDLLCEGRSQDNAPAELDTKSTITKNDLAGASIGG